MPAARVKGQDECTPSPAMGEAHGSRRVPGMPERHAQPRPLLEDAERFLAARPGLRRSIRQALAAAVVPVVPGSVLRGERVQLTDAWCVPARPAQPSATRCGVMVAMTAQHRLIPPSSAGT